MDMIGRIPILMYHQVLTAAERDQSLRRTNPAYMVGLESFRGQMAWLADNGYRALTLDEIIESGADMTRAVAITFDDGWSDNWTNAVPVMQEKGIKATVFVVSGFVGRSGYLTWQQIREMASLGISIQSHTVSHRPLGELAQDEIHRELRESKDMLEQKLGSPVDFVSMPQGVFSPLVLKLAHEAGYRGVCTSEPHVHHADTPLNTFGRINIDGNMALTRFSRILQMDPWAITQLWAVKEMKNFLKGLVGYERYRKFYQLRYKIDAPPINR